MGCFDLEVFVELNQRSRKASNYDNTIANTYFFQAFDNHHLYIIAVAVPNLPEELLIG